MTDTMGKVRKALESARRSHRYCDDSWYSCPKSEDGCADESQGDECNCGADEVNIKIDDALRLLDEEAARVAALTAERDRLREAVKFVLEQEPREINIKDGGFDWGCCGRSTDYEHDATCYRTVLKAALAAKGE